LKNSNGPAVSTASKLAIDTSRHATRQLIVLEFFTYSGIATGLLSCLIAYVAFKGMGALAETSIVLFIAAVHVAIIIVGVDLI
jgi:ABC-type transport system involved in cytochrome bd biosynthesis fused ATPase/permease subunit